MDLLVLLVLTVVTIVLVVGLVTLSSKLSQVKTLQEQNQTSSSELLRNSQDLDRRISDNMTAMHQLMDTKLEQVREVVDQKLTTTLQAQTKQTDQRIAQLDARFDAFQRRVDENMKTTSQTSTEQLGKVRETVDKQLSDMRKENEAKLELMRQTVDEKLQKTLDERMTQSFQRVSTQLEQVHQGLGEMRGLAEGVGDLKKVLSGVKTRGIVGEIQLGAILRDILSPEQYEENVATVSGSSERVEFAVKLPGESGETVWLPIDSKFPGDTYEHLVDAINTGNEEAIIAAKKSLEARIKAEAKDISTKYIAPPETTNFAILFLPFEGLYAEVVSQVGLLEQLQREYRVNVCGPSTMAALLNSLQMGFQSVAIQKHADEIQKVLSAVKTEFETYQAQLEKAQKQIRTAETTIDKILTTRTKAMNRKLRGVTALESLEDAQSTLGLVGGTVEDQEDDE
ncbi:DNA recombination protein RmuC [Lancefieldella parvula]|uniref:DNA recombination protein RmuC n=1 Tax=Lancefieldella parvula TaxID=1382 RepID=UPI0028D17823|nr:DNA recombination protein RmuC [Lancefieldella parvula]